MRAPANLLQAGLAAGAALLLLTACGGSGDEQSDAAATSAGSSSAGSAGAASSGAASSGAGASGSTSDEDVQAFCSQAESVFSEISAGLDAAQPTGLLPALDQAVSAFDQITPPAEISGDWDTAQQAFVGIDRMLGRYDPDRPPT